MRGRPGLILPVVLVLVGLLAMIMAGFMFFVRAEVAGLEAQRDTQQARLAAESGLEELRVILSEHPDDLSAWWHVPVSRPEYDYRFRHALVWSEAFDRESDPVGKMGSREELLEEDIRPAAWRYSIVAQRLDGLPDTMRYGITPEASKLNLNARQEGWEGEIERLATPLLMDLGLENTPELIAALLDWLDEDSETRASGAEDDYYINLEPGYYAKNGPLDTVEELLLVKGWTAAVLYGEDYNRNGILDPNEDDGDESFPYYDDGDGELDLGLAPFVTVWSREPKQPPQGGPQGGGAGGGGGEEENVAVGLIHVNTAPVQVLRAIEGMPPGAAESIVMLRENLDPEALKKADWLVSAGALDPGTYEQITDRITTRALQFHVEIVGYGDHTQLARRYEWIVELRGSIMQVLYHRDLTALGLAWPIDDDTFVVRSE